MKMTKKELFARINGKSATYSNALHHNHYEHDNESFISELTEKVKRWNAENPDKRPAKVEIDRERGIVEAGTQLWRLAKPAKTGTISVHSDHLFVCGVRMDKADIEADSITENSFKTAYGSTVIFQ